MFYNTTANAHRGYLLEAALYEKNNSFTKWIGEKYFNSIATESVDEVEINPY